MPKRVDHDERRRELTAALLRIAGTARLDGAQAAGEVDAGRDPRTEVAALLALANGLTSSILGHQHTPEEAAAVLRYALDHVFLPTASPAP